MKDSETITLPLKKLRGDGGTQSREQISDSARRDYREAYQRGEKMPPLVAFYDGRHYWLADGFTRLAALQDLQRAETDVLVYHGTLRDAVLYAAGANAKHGAQRTAADKRRSVRMLLDDKEWAKATKQWLAEAAGVSVDLVESVLSLEAGGLRAGSRQTKDGRTYTKAEAVPNRKRDPQPRQRFKREPNGQAVMDFDRLQMALGMAVKSNEQLAHMKKDRHPEYHGMKRLLTECLDLWKKWKKRVTSEGSK